MIGIQPGIAGLRLRAMVRRFVAGGLAHRRAPRRSGGDEYARALLLAAARVWLTDTTPLSQTAGHGAAAGDDEVLAEVERHYPGGVRQLSLDTFADALATTPPASHITDCREITP